MGGTNRLKDKKKIRVFIPPLSSFPGSEYIPIRQAAFSHSYKSC